MKSGRYRDFDRTAEEVFHANAEDVELRSSDLDALISGAENNTRRRSRFCLHRSSEDAIHEMVIAHPRGAYVRPHKHLGKAESMLILEGEIDYFVFNDDGSIRDLIEMSGVRSGNSFYKKIPQNTYHSFLIQSEWLIFLEVTGGPFRSIDTVFPSWAPPEGERGQVNRYMNKLSLLSSNRP